MNSGLQVSNLQAAYGAAQVLFDVSFSVSTGEVVTLLGRNGMGRSTTIKCLFGLLAPASGRIAYNGQPLSGLPSYRIARRGMSLVPEGRQIFPKLSVEENLIATARKGVNGNRQWHLERVYSFFPVLRERRSNMGHALSGGEQQMLAIGRALMINPRLLVLDEATEGLAPVVRNQIWRTLHRLREEGLSMVIVDKNIKALMELADRHYVLDKGRIVWSGNSTEMRKNHDVVQRHLTV